MRSSFGKAFEITVGLEGKPSTDPHDPGNYMPDGSPGFTIWGLSSKYNPNISKEMTLDEAKDLYLFKYWIPAGCDEASFPMDICLFDSQVNPQNDPKLPGGGNQEVMNLNPESWQDYCILRMQRYMRCSKDIYVKGHIFRVLKLAQQIKELK